MQKDEMKPWITLLIAIASVTFGAAIGYGVSQSHLAKIVVVTARDIESLKASDSAFERRMERFEATSSAHMTEAIELFKKQMEVQQKFINLLEVQNALRAKGQ